MREKVNKHSAVIEKFWNRWKTEYLTSLREFNRISGHNKEVIKVGDVVIVHDEKPRMQWTLAVVEGLITCGTYQNWKLPDNSSHRQAISTGGL